MNLYVHISTYINSLDDASNNWLYAQKKIKEQNKIKFLKTHSCLGAYKGKPFTTVDYSLGGIYVVRDPRNVISSVMNHFSLNIDVKPQYLSVEDTSLIDPFNWKI